MAAPTLAEFRSWVGGTTPPTPDDSTTLRLTAALAAATEQVEARCYSKYVDPEDADYVEYPYSVHLAILIQGNRYYHRADGPGREAGYGDEAGVWQMPPLDSDVVRLAGRYIDLSKQFA